MLHLRNQLAAMLLASAFASGDLTAEQTAPAPVTPDDSEAAAFYRKQRAERKAANFAKRTKATA